LSFSGINTHAPGSTVSDALRLNASTVMSGGAGGGGAGGGGGGFGGGLYDTFPACEEGAVNMNAPPPTVITVPTIVTVCLRRPMVTRKRAYVPACAAAELKRAYLGRLECVSHRELVAVTSRRRHKERVVTRNAVQAKQRGSTTVV